MSELKFTNGLIPAIVRDAKSGAILSLAFMNEESLAKTKETGQTWFWSRSRNQLWHKGETSGNTQHVVHIAEDCDHDSLVVTVDPAGPACHTGAMSCFDDVPPPALDLAGLMRVLRDRYATRPAGSYSASLFDAGREKIVKKVGEESAEVIIAALSEPRERVISEVADLLFHVSVLLTDVGIDWSEVGTELARRAK
jgi:phosphoribosyl-ATP pyrophosphohydrolase/phosphoribosyl-AMP cyclohydrolase